MEMGEEISCSKGADLLHLRGFDGRVKTKWFILFGKRGLFVSSNRDFHRACMSRIDESERALGMGIKAGGWA